MAGLGKVPRDFLERYVFPNLGAESPSLLVKPGQGLDNSVVSVGADKVLLLTSDPLSVIPSVGLEQSARLSVHLLASDLATSGVGPQFAMLDFNLPAEMNLSSAGAYLRAVGEECRKLGVSIAGGHTGRYPGSGYTVVGGGTMLSVAESESYVTPAMALEGDAVLLTKGAAIGAAAVLSHAFPLTLEEKIGKSALRRAKARLAECSTVKDALTAATVGLRTAVTSMHDATEGGVLGAISELSSACGLPVIVESEKVHAPEEALLVCEAFGLDPLTTLSEGSLLITCRPGSASLVSEALARVGVESFEVGQIGERTRGRGLWLARRGSEPRRTEPGPDGYWGAYSKALRQGWN